MEDNQEPKRYQLVGTKVDSVLSSITFIVLAIGIVIWLMNKA